MSPATSKILLTGSPGIGKTTVIVRLAELLAGRRLAGFYTDEIRESGERRGFRVTTLTGKAGILADLRIKSRHRVGRYSVDIASFEALVLPELGRPAEIIIIDEIGKMECFSRRFIETVRGLLDGPTPVIATVAMKGTGFITVVKELPNTELLHVTAQNRDEIPERLVAALSNQGGA